MRRGAVDASRSALAAAAAHPPLPRAPPAAAPRLFHPAVQKAQHDVESLAFEAQATHVRLSNALTTVSLLMNTQFIENVRGVEGGVGVGVGGSSLPPPPQCD